MVPQVYYTYVELYGREDGYPELTRYICDINAKDVLGEDMLNIRYYFQVSIYTCSEVT